MSLSATRLDSPENPAPFSSGLLVAAALLVGTVARIAMWVSEKSFWGDEWFSVELAKASSLTQTFLMAVRDVHPPLYYLALRGAVRLLGPSELALRSISFAAGIGTLWVLAALMHRYLKSSAAICIWLMALSPYWLQSANEIRSYALMAFCVTAGTYAFCRSRETEASKNWTLAYVLMSLAAVYTEHYVWFWVLAISGYLIVERIRGDRSSGSLVAQGAILCGALPSLGLIGYQAVFGEHVFDASRVGEYWNLGWMTKKIAGIFWHLASGYEFAMLTTERVRYYATHSPYFWASTGVGVLGLAFFGRGLTALRREHPFFFWLALLGFTAPLIFLWICYPIRLHARYLSFAAPWFFLAVAVGIGRMPRGIRAGVMAGFMIVGLIGVVKSVQSQTDRVHREDYRSQTRYILTHARPGDAVAGLKPQFDYYQRQFGIPFEGKRFAGMPDLNARDLDGVRRVWVPAVLNMHPEVSERMRVDIDSRLRIFGFEPAGEPVLFGGPEALTVLYSFEINPTQLS